MRTTYKVLERLGGGGQAEVFRGVAETLQGFKKAVAIKRVLPNLTSNPQFVAMFLDEARLSLFLQHANVVQVFDISKADDGTYFLVMEFVDGCDLKALIHHHDEQGIKDIELALHIIIEACKGLHYAHHLENPQTGAPLGIVHRDVSPPNIMLSKNGEVKVVDFGLAKANSQVEITDEGVVKGKFAYLAPEATLGLEVDLRADVFALGIITWEMLTGYRLFYNDNPHTTIELVKKARVPSIVALNTQVDPELEKIVRKALARERDDRFQTAAEYMDALSNHLFARQMKVTSRNVAAAVNETREAKARAASPKQMLIQALVMDEINKMTSLIADELAAKSSLDNTGTSTPLVDTTDWAKDLLDD
jgi:eukaryotic-like serine/threonine-protein kinase